MTITVDCVFCGAHHSPGLVYRCHACGGVLEARNANASYRPAERAPASSMWSYRDLLPLATDRSVSLGEWNSPVLDATSLLKEGDPGPARLLIKDETRLPTGSFKDRSVAVSLTRALELGAPVVTCASSGNAGASTAAYAARAGVPAVVFVSASAPAEKLWQIGAYGARLVLVEGDYSDVYQACVETAATCGWANLTTTYINPYGVAGLTTVGWELVEQLHYTVPDAVFAPVGSGPLLYGIYQGFRSALSAGAIATLPRLVAVQAAACAPIAEAYEAGADTVRSWTSVRPTIAGGIADPLRGYELDGTLTLRTIRATGGAAIALTEAQIESATADLASGLGVLAEPTGASSVAGVRQFHYKRGAVRTPSTYVAMVTGHGFKDVAHWPQPALRTTRTSAHHLDIPHILDDLHLEPSEVS